ncbi:MAG: hypothetical protein ACRDIE_19345, partial [Chloroflexota bacterium]
DDLEALEEGLAENELEALEGTPIEHEAPLRAPIPLEAQALLARARRLLASAPTDEDLREAVVSLETRLHGSDAAAIDTAQEALLDLVYDRDES